MKDKDAIKQLIGIVINDSYDKEFELLRWLFAEYATTISCEVQNNEND